LYRDENDWSIEDWTEEEAEPTTATAMELNEAFDRNLRILAVLAEWFEMAIEWEMNSSTPPYFSEHRKPRRRHHSSMQPHQQFVEIT
jgi:hypothetical protein